MEPTKLIEDQFSKLHPTLPVNTRIGIIGAGPSGLSAAYALSKLGYSTVTVLEKYHTVAGMCESVEIEGNVYDLGGQVLAGNSAPVIFHLAKETGSELEEMDSHKLALIDSSTGQYRDIKVADDYVSVISLTLELQDKAKNSGRIGIHALSDIASDLTPTFLENHGLKSIPKSVAYGYTASGYGYIQDMPYAYIHEFTRTSMAGKIRRFKGGYTSLWTKISNSLPIKVHCDTEVLAVNRDSDIVTVKIRKNDGESEVMEFDKIIITGAFPLTNGKIYRSPRLNSAEPVMDMNELEKELFGKVHTIDYYTTVLKIKGLDHLPIGFYYFGEYMDDPATIGYPVAMQKFFSDTDIFLFWSYGNSFNIQGQAVADLAVKTATNMGGKVEKIILQRRFKYFPHVSSQDMKDGFYERFESEIQGERNTYYVGGLMAFELTERNSSYAMALVCKHFANDDPLPNFPYVKNLFTLQSECWSKNPRELGELPGVEFPDLPTLDGYLKHWGNHRVTRNKTLYTWLNEEGEVVGKRTYEELNANASCIAYKLLNSKRPEIKPGDRVLLIHVPGLEFIDAFFGCLRAKILPVPVLPVDPLQRGGQALLKIENIAKSSGAVAILSTVAYHTAVRAGSVKNMITWPVKNQKSSACWPKLTWLHTDSWIKSSNPDIKLPDVLSEPDPGDVCFLQFTSGSTGDAKGVMITHGGLVHNVKLMRRIYKSTSKTILISWLPQYHDMGLIGGLFTSLVSGGSAVLFSPIAFIRNPLMWLQVMSEYRATHSAGPNFAFELVLRRLESDNRKSQRFDLSAMIFLMIAAEPVRQKTLKRFIELTRPFGLSQEAMAPGYGLAENCVFVSCAFGEGRPISVDWQGRVCCGYVNRNNVDIDIRIVDPETSEELKDAGKEGEIWISSPSSGVGYWGKEELSRKTFNNELRNHPGRIYTRTGDLGRTIGTKLFITGRIKDLIIVAGRNIYSADVEKTVESSSELLRAGCCAVIGVPEEILSSKGIAFPDSGDQIGLVVIAELKDGKPVSSDIVEKIKIRVTEEHGVSVAAVKLIKPRTISKTTSGKIKRFECLKQFTDNTLNVVPDPIMTKSLVRSFTTGTCKEGRTPRPSLVSSPISRSRISNREIVEFLRRLVSDQTGIPVNKISTTESLLSYGIDSIGVVRAAQKLSDFLQAPIGAVDIFTATCIDDLANLSETLMMKSQPQQMNSESYFPEPEIDSTEFMTEVSRTRQIGILVFQLLALVYISALLIIPACLSISAFTSLTSDENSWSNYLLPLAFAPLSWILCTISTCISIVFFGKSFLQPNYALTPEIPTWSVDFVRWWALYKAQEIASKVLAVHLRGTIFLNYWFQMLGARIGSSVLLDTIDITDPSLVSIGDGSVIAEGATLQSHEVKNGLVSFHPIRIGQNSSVGPYAILQKGSSIHEGVNIPPLQKCEATLKANKARNNVQKGGDRISTTAYRTQNEAVYHFIGIYTIGFLSSLSAGIVYFLYIGLLQKSASPRHFAFLCISGTFHWIPFILVVYASMFDDVPSNPISFALFLALAYFTHGVVLTLLTSILTRFLTDNPEKTKPSHLKTWLCHRVTIACHLKFAKFLSGTEAFCMYLRVFGAKVGQHCSIRAINPISDPKLIELGDGVHLGDFSRIVTGFYSSNGFTQGNVEVQDNSVVGSQSLVLPGSIVQENVIIGALSIAPVNSVLQRGGVYVGSQAPVMIKNTLHASDDRIEEMDIMYKKIVGNLAANLAATTLKVKSRYFHRIGVSGRGRLKIYDHDVKDLPLHKIFHPGKSYPVLIRHSNSLSTDDDARIDARGAAIRILSEGAPLLDLTLKTGNAFYARTIADFATWLVCGLAAREEHVKRVPHVQDAVWNSLRNADSFTELHYYSNFVRVLRFVDGQERYVKFKLRPYDENIGEDNGKVKPIGILPPETGAIPRDEKDTRPLLFLADDFQSRVNSSGGVRYIFQLQVRPIPDNEDAREVALDCTKPWNSVEFPYIDVGEIFIDQNLTGKESEELEYNPFLRCPEIDVVRASSCSQSASIDHGRSLIYEICQHLRNGEPLPEAWRIFLEQSDLKVDLSGCPMAGILQKKEPNKVTLEKTWYLTLWSIIAQPFLQTVFPHFLLALVIFAPLNWTIFLKNTNKLPLHLSLPLLWLVSGILLSLTCVIAKYILVGKKKEGETVHIWSLGVFLDTTWQAFRTLVGEYFLEILTGSHFFLILMKLMGSNIELDQGGAYVDSMGAMLNPEMVEIESGGCVGREALLFGHIYEGEGGKVKFGKIMVGEGAVIGSRAVAMPGVRLEPGSHLSALSLAMKGEIIKSK
jgi:non-ribosomal peptide synthetase-like protein